MVRNSYTDYVYFSITYPCLFYSRSPFCSSLSFPLSFLASLFTKHMAFIAGSFDICSCLFLEQTSLSKAHSKSSFLEISSRAILMKWIHCHLFQKPDFKRHNILKDFRRQHFKTIFHATLGLIHLHTRKI